MSALAIEEIDLLALTEALRLRLGDRLEASYLRGKTALRDAVADHFGCSDPEAEQLVETLELQGFVRFPHFPDETHPSGRRFWQLGRARWTVE